LNAAETGSFSAAARRLGKAQSTISTLIVNLEIDIGKELFKRAGRSTSLTPEGEALLKEARSVAQAFQLFQNRCDSLTADVEESLVLAIDESTIERTKLTPVFQEFGETFPLTKLVFLDTAHSGPFDLITSGEAQLGIMYSPEDSYSSEIHFRGIAKNEFISVTSSKHPLSEMIDVTPEELAAHRHIRITSREALDRKTDSELSQRVWYTDSYRHLRALVKEGFGWADMPIHLISQELKKGTLKRIDTQHQRVPFSHNIDLVWSKVIRPGQAMRWLIDAFSDL